MKKIVCNLCKKEITANNFEKHVSACKTEKKEKISISDFPLESDGLYKCKVCGKKYSLKAIFSHFWRSHTDVGRKHKPTQEGHLAWNKGLTKETNKKVAQFANTLKAKHALGEIKPSFLGKHHTDKTKKVLSAKLSKNNKGGRCKWYDFKRKNGTNTRVQGTWEYRFSRVIEEIDDKWIKVKGEKEHLYKWADKYGKEHHYTPDFYSPRLNKYFEVKGYWWGNDKEKMEYVKNQYPNVIFDVIKKKELEKYENLFNFPHKMEL